MKSVQAEDAPSGFSVMVEAAERGEPTTIIKHGRPAAVLVSVEDALKLYPENKPSFADFLLSFPGAGQSSSGT